jgi:hypothetical protein
MELGWVAVIQAIIMAVCTIIVRFGAKKDKAEVKADTSSPAQVSAVDQKLTALKADFETFRENYFKANPVKPDNRGPERK